MPEDSGRDGYRPAITVTGGAGGIDADLTDMASVAAQLGRVGEALEDMWALASADALSVLLDTDAAACPGTAGTAALDMAALTAGPASLLATGTALTTLRSSVSTCKTAYEIQDRLRKDGFTQFLLTGAFKGLADAERRRLGTASLGVAVFTWRHGRLPQGGEWVDYVPLDATTTTKVVGILALAGKGDTRLVTGVIYRQMHEQPVVVRSAVRRDAGKPARGTADLLRQTDLTDYVTTPGSTQRTKDTHEMRLTRVTRPDGSHAWIVAIPGTENFGEQDSSTTRDSVTNTGAASYARPHAMDGIEQALERQMRAAGADPAKEPVMLVGHSQGGILAARLASDPGFRSKFQVRSVLTAGTPAAKIPPPEGTQMLCLEHDSDVVAATDGAENGDHPTMTTVHRNMRLSPPGDAPARLADGIEPGQGVLNPHRLGVYEETARTVDESDSASVGRWRDDSAAFLDATSQESWTVDMERDAGAATPLRVEP